MAKLNEIKPGKLFIYNNAIFMKSKTLWENSKESGNDKFYCLNLETYEMEMIDMCIEVKIFGIAK